MGLISFLKNTGAKLFNRNKKADAPAPEVVEKVTLSKVDALREEVSRLGIPVDGMQIELSEQVTIKGKTSSNADREKVILALGNVDGVGVVDDQIEVTNPEPEAVFYTIQKGDTLGKVAKKQYGDAMRYTEIFEANRPMLEHPDKIYPGQMLRIPQ
jgi:Uncharacterized protein containing LysM domain